MYKNQQANEAEKKYFILWDLDGTVIDSENYEFKQNLFRYASEKMQLSFVTAENKNNFVNSYGSDNRRLFQEIAQHNGLQAKEQDYIQWIEYAFEYMRLHVNDISPRKNAQQLWRQARQQNIFSAIVTNNREDIARAHLKNALLLSLCQDIISTSLIPRPKPAPDLYLAALQKLSLTAKQCVVVEDSLAGVAAAKAAGLRTIAWVDNKKTFKKKISTNRPDFLCEQLSLDILQGFLF